MIDPNDDLFDRLHAAADAVPPSTLDLPVVLLTSRRRSSVRRFVTGTAALTAVAVVAVGIVSGLPSRLATVITPAAGYETLSTETVHEELAPGITAVAKAATYERPDGTVVLDTGLETGAHDERFLIVSSATVVAGGDSTDHDDEDGTAPAESSEGSTDPDDIQRMADLGYAPAEEQHIRLVVGDQGEVERIRDGAEPTTVVLEKIGGMFSVAGPAGTEVMVGLVEPSGGWAERISYLSTWEPIQGLDGQEITSVAVPTLPIAGDTYELYVLKAERPGGRSPFRAQLGVASSTWSVASCGPQDTQCEGTFEPQSREFVQRNDAAELRRSSPEDSVEVALQKAADSEVESDLLNVCLELRGVEGAAPLSGYSRPEEIGIDPDTWRRCIVDVAFTRRM